MLMYFCAIRCIAVTSKGLDIYEQTMWQLKPDQYVGLCTFVLQVSTTSHIAVAQIGTWIMQFWPLGMALKVAKIIGQ